MAQYIWFRRSSKPPSHTLGERHGDKFTCCCKRSYYHIKSSSALSNKDNHHYCFGFEPCCSMDVFSCTAGSLYLPLVRRRAFQFQSGPSNGSIGCHHWISIGWTLYSVAGT